MYKECSLIISIKFNITEDFLHKCVNINEEKKNLLRALSRDTLNNKTNANEIVKVNIQVNNLSLHKGHKGNNCIVPIYKLSLLKKAVVCDGWL